jgi:hypothetical protein
MMMNIKLFLMRVAFSLLIFIFGLYFYPTVFDTWGYMYSVTLVPISIWMAAIIGSMIIVLVALTNYKNILFRHVFDVMILGIFFPTATIVLLINSSWEFVVIPFVSVLLISITVFVLDNSLIMRRMIGGFKDGISFDHFIKIVGLIYLVTIGWLILNFGFSSLVRNMADTFLETYEIRSVNRLNGLLGYLLGWAILVFFPLFITLTFERKQLRYWIIGALGAFIVFQVLAVKVIFLNYLLLTGFCFGYSSLRPFYKLYLPYFAFTSIFIIGVVGYDFGTAILDRFYYLIGLNSVFYFEYFSSHPPMYFAGTKLDLGYGNYDIGPGYVIDNAYYGSSGSNSSAGFLPSIFADLRWIGVICVSLFLGLFFVMIEKITFQSQLFAYSVAIALVFALMNHAFMMLFLSNGLMVILFIAFFGRRRA